MKTSLPIGMLALASLLVVAAMPAQAQSTEYDWAYLFAGQSQRLEIDVGPNAVLFTLNDITVDGQLAADARAAIDNLQGVGDGDGQLSSTEVTNFEGVASLTINSLLPQHFEFEMITIDGMRAYVDDPETNAKIQLTMLKIDGATGPVTSTDPITTDLGAKLRFDSVDQSRAGHLVRFENVYGDLTGVDEQEIPPAEVQIRAYRSWTIVEDSIEPTMFVDRLSEDTLTFSGGDLAYFDEQGEGLAFTMKGDPSVQVDETKRDSPTLTPVAFVGALALLALAIRRRL